MVIRKCVPNALGRATDKMGYSILTRELVIWILVRELNMELKCTVTTDLQAKDINGYSGIQKHVEHDENIKHSNQDIVFSETRFNQYDESQQTRQNVEKWNEEHFKDFVE